MAIVLKDFLGIAFLSAFSMASVILSFKLSISSIDLMSRNRQNHLVFGQPSTPLLLGNFETSRRVILDLKLRDYTALDITQEKGFQQIKYISSVDLVTNRSNIQMT